MAKLTKTASYQAMAEELETITSELQRENIDVDSAVRLYERGLALTKQLETYLTSVENRITKVSKQDEQSSK